MLETIALQHVALSTGVGLDVVDVGPRDGEVLIFLHGFPESHRTWRHQIAHFQDRYRCIAPDQRGYGRSDKPEGVEHYSADRLTADIFALADALGVGRFTIVGHDWGGAIAWSVALNGMANRRVERAIIANAPHPFIFQRLLYDDPAQRAASQYIRTFRDTAHDPLIHEQGLAAFLRTAVNWERSAAMDDGERDLLMAAWREPGAAIAMLNWYRATALTVPAMDEKPARPAMLDSAFPVLSVPTLVIWAMDDLALPASNLDGLDSVVADLTVERVQGCGHFVPWEAPDAVNAAMARWLATHPL